ncbi:hypothetical protein GF420_11540 [candidate division GN15 bacterium]|nr:hypothetical protein [candidate division GN15 bacterium]
MALVTYSEYVEQYLGKSIDKVDASLEQSRIEALIDAVSAHIESYCDRKFQAASGLSEVFDGDGTEEYWTANWPITDTPTISYWDGTQWIEATSSLYPRAMDADIGRIYFTQGDTFFKGKNNWRVVYSYGYAVASVPADLKQATYELVHRLYLRAQGKQGIASETHGDVNVSYSLGKMPDNVKQLLDRKYKRVCLG